MRVSIKNEICSAEIDTHGAELKSVKSKDREYMWQADPAYWNRTSPVLFPFVGAVNEGIYRYEGKEYPMSQHGFARDMDFEILDQSESKASFRLVSTEETRSKYPFSFELIITYLLEENTLTVFWSVKNTGNGKMYFSIGAHPAFLCQLDEKGTIGGNYLRFDAKDRSMTATDFADGLVQETTRPVALDKDGCFALDEHTFDTPLFGVWAPEKKNAPFLCIEPWYGRADAASFAGELKERAYEQVLEENAVFEGSYQITFS